MAEYDVTNKHWPGCWRYASHHACAVAEVERLRGELGELKARAALATEWMQIMYHCQECGYFFRDAQGTQKEGLHGQQSDVAEIVCEGCGRDGPDEEEAG